MLNVKFYPTKTNFKRSKNPTLILSVWNSLKKLSQYKQLILKINTALTLKQLQLLHTPARTASVFPSGNSRTASKMKDLGKSNIRNFTLLPFFTDPSTGGAANTKRIAKSMSQNTSTEMTLRHGPREPAGHWTRSKKKTGASIKLIFYHFLSTAPHWAQRPFAPEETMWL